MTQPRHVLPSEALARRGRAQRRAAATAAAEVHPQAIVRGILVDPDRLTATDRQALRRAALVEARLLEHHVAEHGTAAGFAPDPPHQGAPQ